MKKNIKLVFSVALILFIACSISLQSVSALSSDGESLLSQIAQAGSSVGFDIGGIIESIIGTTVVNTSMGSTDGAQEALSGILEKIDIRSDIMKVIDLINYIQKGGSFAEWINSNYGSEIEIPDSIKNLTPGDIIKFVTDNFLSPTSVKDTSTDYQFVTTDSSSSSEVFTETEPESISQVIIDESTQVDFTTEISKEYITGDVNLDGIVTAADARLALRAGAGLIVLTEVAVDCADVNGDGRVSAKDARSILRYSAGISSSF